MRTWCVNLCACVAIALSLFLEPIAAWAATYDVGQNQQFTTLGAVPWPTLQPGDTVNIHGQAQPYHELILLTASGTAGNPITVQGVPGPNGEPAVIDGTNGVESPSIGTVSSAYAYTYSFGLVQIGCPRVSLTGMCRRTSRSRI